MITTNFWQISPEWKGETAFVVAGGPSVAAIDLNMLRGQKVIAVNSSFRAVPFADFLIFADGRWWEFNRRHLADWKGRIVCCSRSPRDKQLLMVKRKTLAGGFSDAADTLTVQFTSSTAAIDLAVKLGASKIVLLGLDGKNAADGKTHHHSSHPWRQVAGWEKKHRKDLAMLAGPLKLRGIEVLLGTPGSAYADLWPTVDLSSLIGVRAEVMAA
jgi:hypothetical protein